MNQRTTSAPELHADHRHWMSELSMWQDDVEIWRAEYEAALQSLARIKDLIAAHSEKIGKHEQRINAISDALEYHEKTLKESLRGGSDSDLDDALLERHQQQLDAIAAQRYLHENIKKHHHTAMAQVATLKASLDRAT